MPEAAGLPFRMVIFIVVLLSGAERIADGLFARSCPRRCRTGCTRLFSICSICTMAFTSRLIGQLLVQVLQSAQAEASASRRREGQPKRLRSQRPMIMKGAIQQMVWQPARRPTKTASPTNRTTTR